MGAFLVVFVSLCTFLCTYVWCRVCVCTRLSCYYTLQDPLKQDQLKRLVYKGSYIIMASALRVT